jgi:hypothetical protein
MDEERRKERNFKPRVKYVQPNKRGNSLIVTPEGIFAQTNGEMRVLADAVDFFWGAIGHNPAEWDQTMIGYRYLLDHASDAEREDLRRALNWLEATIPARARAAMVAAAQYIAAMPATLLASDEPRLQNILNSRILGVVWHITPDFDVKPLPPSVPKFGNEAGYGLIRSVPELYVKAMELSPAMETIVIRLASEAKRYNVSLPPELLTRLEP